MMQSHVYVTGPPDPHIADISLFLHVLLYQSKTFQ